MKHLSIKKVSIPSLERTRRFRRYYFCMAAVLSLLTISALANGDPLSTINNLSDFVFDAIRALGIIILGWGIVQIGMSLQSHDSSQRTQGFLGFFGGLLIAFSKTILTTIGV